MKRCEIKLGSQGLAPPAVDEIKIFDNDDKATKHSFLSECFAAFSSLSKILISSTAGGLGRPIWFHIFFILAFLVLGRYIPIFTPGVFWLRYILLLASP